MSVYPPDKRILFQAADGPESLVIYKSEENAIVDIGCDIPGLYVTATVSGAYVRLGPFQLRAIRESVERALAGSPSRSIP